MPEILRLSEGQTPPPADIEDLDWLVGCWRGEVFGGQAEECWSPPWAGTMVGTYRHIMDGSLNFYELIAIESVGESLVLRLKHFDPGLTGWEEADQSVDFSLVRITERAAYFDGISLILAGKAHLEVHLRMKQDGEEREEVFHYHRLGEEASFGGQPTV